jgi:hypothetical protein
MNADLKTYHGEWQLEKSGQWAECIWTLNEAWLTEFQNEMSLGVKYRTPLPLSRAKPRKHGTYKIDAVKII